MAFEVSSNHGDGIVESMQNAWTRVHYKVEIQRIMRLVPECVTASIGTIDPSVPAKLLDRHFDHAPASGVSGRCDWGLVSRLTLEELLSTGTLLTDKHLVPSSRALWDLPAFELSLPEVFAAFAEEEARLLVSIHATAEPVLGVIEDNGPAPVIGWRDGVIHGFMTRSDLNHREVRRACYELIVECEQLLADVVRIDIHDNWTIFNRIENLEQRAWVVGHWTLLEKAELQVHPTQLLTFAQLVRLAGKSEYVLSRLGHKSRSKFEQTLGNFAEFRNRVMHPTRTLIASADDVRSFERVTSGLMAIIRALNKASSQEEGLMT